MIRLAHWPDDARGPLLVVGFDDNDDIDRFDCSLKALLYGCGELDLQNLGGAYLYGFSSFKIVLGRESAWRHANDEAILALNNTQAVELRKLLAEMKRSSIPCHNYLYIAGDSELLLTKSEYEPRHFL